MAKLKIFPPNNDNLHTTTRTYSRWKGALLVQSREVCSLLLAILKFPNGWLTPDSPAQTGNDADPDRKNRPLEMEYLRKTCVTETAFLLQSVYHSTGQYKEALQLADLIAAEQGCLYQCFSKEDMRKFLLKLKESSVAVMEADGARDALGY